MTGQSIAHYRVTAKLGQGGMGAVYRATDTRLDREVAIKVLPESFAQDRERLARFEREAKVLASLNHPNIAGIFGLEQTGNSQALVLELVEGEDLSERLKPGPLPLEEALEVCKQIAEALEAAHEKGIIHRDLKPGNVKLTPGGRVKVLDFGLAKAAGGDSGAIDPDAATLVAETTTAGAVMGTPAYMSPEQARGQTVDRRTDVWAFGCCLYECLTGAKPFRGDTVTDLMAAVLRSEPDWNRLPGETPREVSTLLRRCLEKDPRRRLSGLGDIAILLDESTHARRRPAEAGSAVTTARQPAPASRNWAWPTVAAVLGVALVVAGYFLWRGAKSPAAGTATRTLAVLPFENLRPEDSESQYLASTLRTALKEQVRALKGLEIKAPGTAGLFATVRGTFVRVEDQYRVSVEMLGADQSEMPLGTYTSPVTNIFPLQDRIAVAVAEKLRGSLTEQERSQITARSDVDPEAYIAFQKGLKHLDRGQLVEARASFNEAIELDPGMNVARNQLVLVHMSEYLSGGNRDDHGKAYEDFKRHVAGLPEDVRDSLAFGEARLWVSIVYDRDWRGFRQLYGKLREEIDRPSEPDIAASTLFPVSWYYALVEGRLTEALQALRMGASLAPDRLWRMDEVGQLRLFGREPEARGKVPNPENEQRSDPRSLCGKAQSHIADGDVRKAREILDVLEQKKREGLHIPYGRMALVYGELDDFENAYRWLDDGLHNGRGDFSMIEIRAVPFLKVFAEQPRYWAVINRLDFPPLPHEHPYHEVEERLRYGRGTDGEPIPTTSTNQPPKTLAVLPFDNIGAGAADDDFNEGLTIELITLLQNVKGLQVQGPMSSMRFKGAVDGKQVGEQLKVDHLLKGNVRRSGDRLRIDVSLQKAADGFGLWATNYDRRQSDIFTIQAEVAQQVAESLKVKLGVEDRRALARQPTDNEEAYSLYLQGRAAWNRRTVSEFERATNFFGQALAKDPNFALAYAGMADVHTLWPIYSGEPPGHHSSETIRFARMALERDPRRAEPHAALGNTLFVHHYDWDGAEREFQAAIRLNPESATAHHWYAELLCIVGRPEEALKEAQRSVELDPTPVNKDTVATAMARAGQVDRAVAYLDQLIAAEPSFTYHKYWLFWIFAEQGDLERASRTLAQAERDLGPDTNLWKLRLWKAWLLASLGKEPEAREILAQEQTLSGSDSLRALVLHALGEDREALELLELAVQQRQLLIHLTYHLPLWGRLHGDPRFRAVLRSLNLENHIPVPAPTHAP